VSSRLDVTASSNVGLLPLRRRVRRAAGSATCCSGSGTIGSGRRSVGCTRRRSHFRLVHAGVRIGGHHGPGSPRVTSCTRSRQRPSIGGDAVESHRRVCRAQRSTGIHPRTLRRGYSRLQPEGRHEAGGLQVLHGGVKNATGDPSPRPPGSVADRCRAGTAGRSLRRPDGSVSTLRVELHTHQGADGLAVLGSPWRIPLPMDLRRLPGGDGISRRAALRADSESVGRAYRWALAGTTVSVELIATGDR
jgi:hypothetical protein